MGESVLNSDSFESTPTLDNESTSTSDSEPISANDNEIKKPIKWSLVAFAGVFGLGIILGAISLFKPELLENVLAVTEGWYQGIIDENTSMGPITLITFAFWGGVLGSISPCILAMLPLNLGYIGTLNLESRFDAFRRAGAFVLGVVLITSLFGLVSGFAGLVMVEYRGYLFIAVSIFVLLMAAAMLEWYQLPLPKVVTRMPDAGPFVVGIAFALISSPCSSPILAGVLAMAAGSGSTLYSVFVMAAYGFGYTAIIFFASLFTGITKQVSGLKYHGDKITKIAGYVLILAGLWTFYLGYSWF